MSLCSWFVGRFARSVVFTLTVLVAVVSSAGAEGLRALDDPLFLSPPLANGIQCGFVAECGRFDSIGLHLRSIFGMRGHKDRSFAALSDWVRLSITMLDILEAGGAIGGHFTHDEQGAQHWAFSPASMFVRLRLYPWPWVQIPGDGFVVSASYDRTFVSERLGAAELPGLSTNTFRLTLSRTFGGLDVDAGAGMIFGLPETGRHVTLDLYAGISLNLFVDPNAPAERLKLMLQAVYRYPIARPDGVPGLNEAYVLAGVEEQTASGYHFGLGLGPYILGSRVGALFLINFSVSWGLRYRNPGMERLNELGRRIPGAWLDLFATDPILRSDGCVYTDPVPGLEPVLLKCIGRPDPEAPGKVLLWSGGTVEPGPLWVKDDGTLIDHDSMEVGEIPKELVPLAKARHELYKRLHQAERATGEKCAFKADPLHLVTDLGLRAVLGGDTEGGAASLLGAEVARAIHCGDPKTLSGGGILPLLARGMLKKGPMTYRGSLLGEAEHGQPARIVIDEARQQHIFRDKVGHLKDTLENRHLLLSVANNEKNYLNTDKWGNQWCAELRPDGTQAWVQVRNGQIVNGGLNQQPRSWNPETGLSGPARSGTEK